MADKENFQLYQLLYENKQQWIRHYETLLAQITPVSTTVALGMIAYIADDNMRWWFLAVPAVIISFNIWFVCWCNDELSKSFLHLAETEARLGLYELNSVESVVLPEDYRNSGKTKRPIIRAGLTLQLVSILALLTVLFRLIL